MRKATVFGVLVGSLMAGSAAAAQQDAGSLPPVEEQVIEASDSLKALQLIQSYMGAVTSLKSSFLQRAPNGNLSRGTLYMARPGKIRFDYNDDIPFLVVADGKTLNFVDYEIGQVTKWPVKDTPMLAIIGEGFDLASVNAHIEHEPQGIKGLLALTANDPDKPEMGQVTVYFEKTPANEFGLNLLSWAVIDAQGQVTTVEIFDQEVNVTLANNLWTFDDPRGVAKRRRNRR